MREGAGVEINAIRGTDATLKMVVCADPRPLSASWEWGSLQLKAGEGLGKYQAEELRQVRNIYFSSVLLV